MSTIGAKIDALHALREAKRAKEKEISLLEEQAHALESELIDELDKQGITKSTGRKATVSITESVKPSVDNWDEFYEYIRKHKYFHLLERRPSVTGCRELLEMKGKIPGVVPFTQRKLNIRTV
jgi:predicted metal-binding protein